MALSANPTSEVQEVVNTPCQNSLEFSLIAVQTSLGVGSMYDASPKAFGKICQRIMAITNTTSGGQIMLRRVRSRRPLGAPLGGGPTRKVSGGVAEVGVVDI